jgi:hypothetical protein
MTPVVKGLILMAIAIGGQLVTWLGIMRPLLDLSWGTTAVFAVIGVVLFGVYGFFAGYKEVYSLEPRAIWAFVLDVTWSWINTLTGMIWMIWCLVKGTLQPPDENKQKRGIWHFAGSPRQRDAALPGAAASTIGTVMGGEWLLHESVHVQQARIFGFFYWFIYLASYFTALIMRAVRFKWHRIHWEAYGRVVMEDWAYHAAPDDKPDLTSVEVGPTILWLFLATINAFGILVLFAPIPGLGALPKLIGLTIIPWWIGLIVLFVYAIVRSFFLASDPDSQAEAAAAAASAPAALA